MTWQDGDNDYIKAALINGDSFDVIARHFSKQQNRHITRSAIAGRVSRAGLVGIAKGLGRPGTSAKPRVAKLVKPKLRCQVAYARSPVAVPPTPEVAIAPLTDFPNAASFDDIDFHVCCGWVVQDRPTMYCGEAKVFIAGQRRPYCPWHSQLAKRSA